MAYATDAPGSDVGADSRSVLLYDGDCGFCAGSVQFVLRHEPAAARGLLAFAPLQGRCGSQVRDRFPELTGVDSVVWYDPTVPSVRVRSAAALAVSAHLGGPFALLGLLGRLVPRALRDAVYEQVARRRFELAAPACLLPTAEQRDRFLP